MTRHDGETMGSGEVTGVVVVGVDGSRNARDAVAWAVDEARVRGAILHVVHVSPALPSAVPEWVPDDANIAEVAQAVVDDAVALASIRHPSVVVQGAVRSGAPVPELIEAGAHADLLVLGARGAGGFLGLLVGSVSERCIQQARGPVVVVRAGHDEEHEVTTDARVVVGIDGSPDARRALRWALEEARNRNAPLEAVCAWQYPPTHAVVATSALRFERSAREAELRARDDAARWAPDVPFAVSVVDEAIVPALLDRARGAQLLVVGPHGQGGYRDLLLGSVAHQCVHHAPCPVAVVRNPRGADIVEEEHGDDGDTASAGAGDDEHRWTTKVAALHGQGASSPGRQGAGR